MKKLTMALVVTAMAIAAIAPAQSNGSQSSSTQSTTVTSGPWMMRKSTGDKAVDRLWYIMDRTLNSAESDTLRTMFRAMAGNTGHTLQKSIINAIDNNAKTNTSYGAWTSNDWTSNNGLSDIQVYDALENGLSWGEKGTLHTWMANATSSQLDAVSKLVRTGGWANTMWTTSGMNNG